MYYATLQFPVLNYAVDVEIEYLNLCYSKRFDMAVVKPRSSVAKHKQTLQAASTRSPAVIASMKVASCRSITILEGQCDFHIRHQQKRPPTPFHSESKVMNHA
jgi:hypothetical protein